MDESNIRNLEQRYQTLRQDFEAGQLGETAFVTEVDKLQFQDSYGRYWMLGAKTGTWHYYDGQAWHQADPYQADTLPFVDEHGRYWQRGQKSGDWYYYQPETGEWVKPGRDDVVSAPGQYGVQPSAGQRAEYAGYQADYSDQPSPTDFDGELYQDAEGRYWSVGKKTGQWYFYDRDGWHPAQEFQAGGAAARPAQPGYDTQAAESWSTSSGYEQTYSYPPQPQQGGPQPQAQNYSPPPTDTQSMGGQQPVQAYVVQPQQPASPTQPIQIYITSPGQETRPVTPQQPQPAPYVESQSRSVESTQPAADPAPEPKPTAKTVSSVEAKDIVEPAPPAKTEPDAPRPPKERSESGSWFYFDGEQWLKYAADETADAPPTPPTKTGTQEEKAGPTKKQAAEASVEAEYFDGDDEPPVEVVDVEVITVVEAEVEGDPEPPPSRPEPATRPVEPAVPNREQPQTVPASDSAAPLPRRRPADQSPRRPRVPSEPARPAMPRRRDAAQEPTILIPTGSTASGISPSAPAAKSARASRPQPDRRRRARENTIPMEPVTSEKSEETDTAPHHRVTREMPRQPSDSSTGKPSKPSKPVARQARSAAEAAAESSEKTEATKRGFTLGELLRSMPSTLWTFVGGLVLLLACAAGLIFSWGWLQGGNLDSESLVAVPSLTPTLDAGPPDATPTPGPTPTTVPEPTAAATPAAMTIFSSRDLGYTVEYPENWQQKDDEQCGVFSPSTPQLTRANISDATIWICKSTEEDIAITDLLTEALADFPADAETLNEGTISIASQTWTSAQIRYDSEAFDDQGIATLAVTSKDDVGYYLVAVAPAPAWNTTQPIFQSMINSFTFSTDVVAQAPSAEDDEETEATESGSDNPTRTLTPAEDDETPAPQASPTTEGTATPILYEVQSGDTLLGIALEFGIDADLLASANNIDSPESLQIGQELVIPVDGETLVALATQAAEEDDEEAEAASTPTADAAEETAADETAAEPTAAPTAEAATEAAAVNGRIVYPAFNPGTNVYDVWQVNLDTGEQVVVAGEASQPAFNKDGSLLAYRSWLLGDRGIMFRDYVGGRGGLVTRFVEDALPSWSPDGYSFTFTSRREGDRVPRFYLGNQLGEQATAIGFQGTYVSTFPDGRLVVKGCTVSGDCGLFVMGASGGGETKISDEVGDNAPAASPDGSKVAFMSAERGATNWEIWVMNADGTNPQRLTENGSNDGLPAWSPDGQSIAFVSDQGGVWAIWVMNADGSNQRKLANMQGSPDGQVLRDINNSKGWLEERISWAP